MKRTRKELNALHRNPLPVELSVDTRGELPLVNVSNGVSWLWLWIRVACMYMSSPPRAPKIRISIDGSGAFAVRDPADMRRAWENGFFGKGTLSRSEPTFLSRVTNQSKSSEAVTSERRRKRREFKELRAQFQRLEIEERKRDLTLEEKQTMEELQRKMADALSASGPGISANEGPIERIENLENLEFLQLDPSETFFLAFALDVGEVRNQSDKVVTQWELLNILAGQGAQGEVEVTASEFFEGLKSFLRRYVVYHHYRSLGWCVRSGIKFGCDYLLYKRGPPFHHADFGVLITPANKQRVWEDTMAVARVVGGVKKTLVFAYVEEPSLEKLKETWTARGNEREKIMHLLQSLKVCEMVYKRWSPSRTRE